MRGLGAQGNRVDLADDLGDGEGGDKADLAFATGGAQRHAGQVVGVLGRAEVLSQIVGGLEPGGLLELDVRMLGRLIGHCVLEPE